jgi:hypothetical protein
MASDDRRVELQRLDALVGEWDMEVSFGEGPSAGPARTTFEWMPGELMLVQRWEIPVPEAPDGLAVYGWDEGRGTLLQHYFDQRGVARVYVMRIEESGWQLERNQEDFSPLHFSQRFTASLSADGDTIEGTWEISHDHTTYEKDFDITYRRVV